LPGSRSPIAIVGAACRLPGGIDNLEDYWEALRRGKDLVTEITEDRWSRDFFFHPEPQVRGKTYTWAAGVLPRLDLFDAGFFGISPREARQMDPQQRLLLEMAWEALEDGGQVPERLAGSKCGVYLGISGTDYSTRRADDPSSFDGYFMTGNTLSIAANRLSFAFDLRGPSMAVDTACASSLMALDAACKALWSREIPMALTGGINLLLSPFPFIGFAQANMLSPRGRCRTFDASGDGYVRSEGGAMLFLKPLASAQADGDPVHAVILASGTNCDGRSSSLTVPSVDGQEALLRDVYRQSGIDLEQLSYIEAHGTGTAIGDPVECQAIGNAIGRARRRDNPIPIGSVKTNLGHLEPASGVAGLLKVMLAIKHRAIPPSLHLETPNPKIDFDGLNLRLVAGYTPLKGARHRLYMGVNSFGFGGANAHVLLAEYAPQRSQRDDTDKPPLPLYLLLSARSDGALGDLAAAYAKRLEQSGDSCYSLLYNSALRRQQHEYRLTVTGYSASQVGRRLETLLDSGCARGAARERVLTKGQVGSALVFSGNGAQWQGMGLHLLKSESIFRRKVEEVDALFQARSGFSILKMLRRTPQRSRLSRTEVAQPALFALQVGLVGLLRARGVRPQVVVGHSVGEVAAAWAAGALSLEQAVAVIHVRSMAQAQTHGCGRMAALGLSAEHTQALLDQLPGSLEIAGYNSPHSVTLSGSLEELQEIERLVPTENAFYRLLDLDYAFHSSRMDSIEDRIREGLGQLAPQLGDLGFYSTVTGGKLPGTALDAAYWWRNIRQPVRFGEAISALLADGTRLFIEVGPHPVLRGYVNECLEGLDGSARHIATLRRGAEDESTLADEAVAAVRSLGGAVDLESLFPLPAPPLRLPSYPWQREHHWYEGTSEGLGMVERRPLHPLLGYRMREAEAAWEAQIDPALQHYLADHVVGGAVVFPAAGFVEMALAVSREWHGASTHEVEDLDIGAPMVLEEGDSKVVRCVLSPDDGRFSIKSRRRLSDDPWVEHVTGSIKGAVLRPALPSLNLAQETARCMARFDAEAHYQAATQSGLEYGPAFRILEEIFVSEDRALGRMAPGSQDAEAAQGHLLFPPRLDAAFQLLLHGRDSQGLPWVGTRVPFRFGRIRWLGLGEAAFVKATPKRMHRFSHSADILVADAGGRPIALLEDCRFRDAPGTGVARMPGLHEVMARLEPAARLPVSAIEIDLERLGKAVSGSLATMTTELGRDVHYRAVRPLFDALTAAFAWQAIRPMLAGTALSARELVSKHGLDSRQEPYLSWLLEVLQEDGLAMREAGRWRLLPEKAPGAAVDLWHTLIRDHPGYLPELMMVGRCGRHLEALLRDAGRAVNLPFPDTRSGTRDHLCDASPSYLIGNRLVAELIDAIVREWPRNRRLRVLQVSGGELGVSRLLARALPRETADLRIAVVDEVELAQVAGEFSEHPWIEVLPLDLGDADPATQAEASSPPYDLIIATHVLHRIDGLVEALGGLQESLAEGGVLLLLERTPDRISCFSHGVRPGWWSASPEDDRPSPRLLSARAWRVLLDGQGLGPTRVVTEQVEGEPDVFVAMGRKRRSPLRSLPPTFEEELRGTTWLLLADPEGSSGDLAEAVAGRLRGAGARAITLEPGTQRARPNRDRFQADPWQAENWSWTLEALIGEGVASLGILHLLGWQPGSEAAGVDPMSLQERRCLTTIELVKAAARMEMPANLALWLITAAGAPLSAPEQQESWEHSPAQAPLWGLGRVLRNEHPELNCRLLDLHGGENAADTSRRLLAELAWGEGAREVVSAPQGRYVLLLRSLTSLEPGSGRDTRAAPSAMVRLVFTSPGPLRNLQWEHGTLVLPGPGEIQIQVRATGLNFRDVMYCMGLLPDEALEGGFAGATLGLEAAGDVVAVGTGVTDFRVGDPVLCFAPACFSSRINTRASSVVHKPASWSYEEAATVPAVFFTAHYALIHLARLQPGERVLIHGAAGGLGIAALQYACHLGAEIFATAGTEEKRDFLRLIGADHVLDSRSLAFADQIMALTGGEGIDVVVNSLAGEAIRRNLSVLKPFGRFLELGKRDFYENSRIGLRPFRNNISYFGIDADQVMQLQPALSQRLFGEMMDLFGQGVLQPLPHRVFPASQVVDAFQTMQQSRHIGKLVVSMADVPKAVRRNGWAKPQLQLDADAAYLVSGGLSGFGLATARWLVCRGARHLALLGRRGKDTPGAAEFVAELEGAGARVQIVQADVSDARRLEESLRQLEKESPPLRGIIHAAMVLDDALIQNLDWQRLSRVLAPKLLGSWNLHRLSSDFSLDFFVLYSSATTLIGNPGQANYVAANSYLESLAQYRRSMGLPGLFISWGAIDDVGYLSRNEVVKKSLTRRMGGPGLESRRALEMLEKLLLSDRAGCAVVDLDWRTLRRAMPAVLATDSRDNRAILSDQAPTGQNGDVRELLQDLPPEQWRQWVSDQLIAEVSKILRLPPERIETKSSVFELGMDSLMGAELALAVEQRFGVKIPVMAISEGPSLERITDRILAGYTDSERPDGERGA